MIAAPSRAQPRITAKSRSTSARSSADGRLVHDEDAGVLRERLGDLDQLLLAERSRCTAARVESGKPTLSSSARARASLPFGRRSQNRPGSAPRKMFSATVRPRTSVQFLVDAGDAGCLRARRGLRERDAARRRSGSRPASGRLHAGEDLHQRRLARAVLADQAMHLAGPEIEVDRRGAPAHRDRPWTGPRPGAPALNRRRPGSFLRRKRLRSSLPNLTLLVVSPGVAAWASGPAGWRRHCATPVLHASSGTGDRARP